LTEGVARGGAMAGPATGTDETDGTDEPVEPGHWWTNTAAANKTGSATSAPVRPARRRERALRNAARP
jgi:hypothetical protein